MAMDGLLRSKLVKVSANLVMICVRLVIIRT